MAIRCTARLQLLGSAKQRRFKQPCYQTGEAIALKGIVIVDLARAAVHLDDHGRTVVARQPRREEEPKIGRLDEIVPRPAIATLTRCVGFRQRIPKPRTRPDPGQGSDA